MSRFFHIIFMNLFRAPYMIPKMRYYGAHPEKYSEEQRYALATHAIDIMKNSGHITTVSIGAENLPKDSGYVMYPNHQGKYDVLGIMTTHDAPCSFVIDDRRSHMTLVREFTDLLQGKRIKKDDLKQTFQLFKDIVSEIVCGRKYIIFPEGGYEEGKQNAICDFLPGSFKLALQSKAPIVPVALLDSYKVFDSDQCDRNVVTYVDYLDPIYYEDYRGMKTREIAALVQEKIQQAIAALQEQVEAGFPAIGELQEQIEAGFPVIGELPEQIEEGIPVV